MRSSAKEKVVWRDDDLRVRVVSMLRAVERKAAGRERCLCRLS